MTQQAVLAASPSDSRSAHLDLLPVVARLCAVAGLALCAVSVLGWLFARASGGGQVPPWLLWSGFWWGLASTSLLGFWLAVIGPALGLAYELIEKRRGGRAPWTQFIVLVSLVGLAATAGSVLLAHQPAYFLGAGLPQSHARLDAMNARDVVRAYLTSRNLSVQYWLWDAGGRDLWRASNSVPDLSLLAGASGLRVTPLGDRWNRNDATHRSLAARYVTHASDAVGNPAGEQVMTVNLVRSPGGPWRVSYLGDGI